MPAVQQNPHAKLWNDMAKKTEDEKRKKRKEQAEADGRPEPMRPKGKIQFNKTDPQSNVAQHMVLSSEDGGYYEPSDWKKRKIANRRKAEAEK